MNINRRSFFKGLAAAVAVAAVIPRQIIKSVWPQGWLPCDGRVLHRWVYPELYAVMATNYGSDGSYGSFRLPDMRKHGNFVISTSPENKNTPVGMILATWADFSSFGEKP